MLNWRRTKKIIEVAPDKQMAQFTYSPVEMPCIGIIKSLVTDYFLIVHLPSGEWLGCPIKTLTYAKKLVELVLYAHKLKKDSVCATCSGESCPSIEEIKELSERIRKIYVRGAALDAAFEVGAKYGVLGQ